MQKKNEEKCHFIQKREFCLTRPYKEVIIVSTVRPVGKSLCAVRTVEYSVQTVPKENDERE